MPVYAILSYYNPGLAVIPKRRPTIKDIAQMCNVSTQTVSRVINNRLEVSKETRAAVQEAITQMGYQPSALARSLVRQRSYTLGVIIAGLRFVGVSQTLNGITEQCQASGYNLFLKELQTFDTPNFLPVIESLIVHEVEGIIFAAPEFNDNVKVAQSQLPASCPPIIFLKSQPNPKYDSVSVDNRGGARKAVDYLISVGRREVGLITGPMGWLEARQRKNGWEDALIAAGIPPTLEKWTSGDWTSASGEAAFTELIQKYPAMNAIFASNDQMALGVLRYAHTHGIRIPDDLAIIGFDDLSESAHFTPTLSTVTHPLRELGILAVDTLLEQIEGSEFDRPARAITLETKLLLRESTPQR